MAGDAGAKSQVANLWAAGFVLLTLLFLSGIFAFLPSAALAGIVIVAGLGLLDVTDFKAIYRYRRAEFWMAVFTAVAVLVRGHARRHPHRGRALAADGGASCRRAQHGHPGADARHRHLP